MTILWLAFFQVALFVGGWIGPWRDSPERRTNGRLPIQARLAISFSLVVAAFLIWQGQRGPAEYSQWVALGMVASFLGDLIMARVIPLPNRLIGGMALFAVAHGLYITGYVRTLLSIPDPAHYTRWIPALAGGIGFFGVLAVVGWRMLVRNPQKDAATNLGALIYGVWIGMMAANALALGYALGFWLTTAGALCFFASDFIIAVTEIRGVSIKNANDWVWLTYVAGQMAIVYAALGRVF